MKNSMKITKFQIRKFSKKASREIELENSHGWNSILKVHKSRKSYSRKGKNKFHSED